MSHVIRKIQFCGFQLHYFMVSNTESRGSNVIFDVLLAFIVSILFLFLSEFQSFVSEILMKIKIKV
jgi:hypothetical protein